jgi:hypothetical protein
VYVDPARPDGLRGRAALRAYLARLLGANPAMRWTRDRLDPIAGGFSVTWRASVPMPDGEALALKGMDLVLLRGREIVVNEVHFDRARWLAKIGRSPSK